MLFMGRACGLLLSSQSPLQAYNYNWTHHKRERESMMGIETVLVTRETGYTSAPNTGSYDFAAAPAWGGKRK